MLASATPEALVAGLQLCQARSAWFRVLLLMLSTAGAEEAALGLLPAHQIWFRCQPKQAVQRTQHRFEERVLRAQPT